MNGGPIGSMETTAFTSPGRASATSQQNGVPLEWMISTAGPSRFSNSAPQRRICSSFSAKVGSVGPWLAINWSSAESSPISPLPGHWLPGRPAPSQNSQRMNSYVGAAPSMTAALAAWGASAGALAV